MQRLTSGRLFVALIVLGVMAAAVVVLTTVSGRSGTSDVPRPRLALANCTQTVTDAAAAQRALDALAAGSRLCLSGDGMAAAELRLTSSGAAGSPVVVAGDGVVMRSLDVEADHVVVEGLTFVDGEGLTLAGTGLQVRNNRLRGTAGGGIHCVPCRDTVIEQNTVDGSEGTGILIEGQDITLRANTVSGSVKRNSGDADGVRFFGTGLRLTGNTIRDIKDDGFSKEEAPHTDCFQTYDDDRPTTYDVVISGNTCSNVDHQCLIGTASERGNAGVPPGVRSITFENNDCDIEGSQAVYLENYPNVEVRDNTLGGPNLYAGVKAQLGATDVTVTGNRVKATVPPFEVDDESMPGFVEARNTPLP